MTSQTPCTAFEGSRRIASGELGLVALKTKDVLDRDERACVLIFNDLTGTTVEVDFRGTTEDVLKRLAAAPSAPVVPAVETPAAEAQASGARGPGRPRLGVVAREVTLLPRHWEWLNRQPGGASVALRKLVEDARRTHKERDRVRQAQEAAYRFMSTMAGNEPGFEEAARALFAREEPRFKALIERWPADVRDHAKKLAAGALRPHEPVGAPDSA